MSTEPYDFIVIGGGCSGLSLAIELAKKGEAKRILILESRSHFKADRTWCYWNVDSHPFEKGVQYRWNKWKICYQGETLIQEGKRYQYHCIPSESFYKSALDEIKKIETIQLLTGCEVDQVREGMDLVSVSTKQGDFTAAVVYDSRPPTDQVDLYQHFLGWKVVCQQPVFSPDEVTLMDFDVPQEGGVHFMYVLPFTPNSALVESTFISDVPFPREIYEEKLKGYLLQRYGIEAFEIVYQESGVLPLGPIAETQSPRHIPIGVRGGALRSSTGYAFLSIQQQVKHWADRELKRKKRAIDLYLDRVFLSYLKKNLASAPSLFFNLFKKNDPDRTVRFLSGKATVLDLFKTIWIMPKKEMLKEALSLDQSHRFLASRLLFLLVTLLALTLYPSDWPTGDLVLALLLFFTLGIPHGGLDVALGRSLLKPTLGRTWPVVFLGSYLLLAGGFLYFWLEHTFLMFIVFLAISAFHFGFSDTEKKGRFLYLLEGLGRGFVPMALPAYFYPDHFQSLVETVLSQPLAAILTEGAGSLFFPTLLFLSLPFIAGCVRKGAGWLNSLELTALLALFSFLTPLKAFFIYFCFLHSMRHLLKVSDEVNLKTVKATVANTLPSTVGTLGVLAIAYFFIRQEMWDVNSMVYLFFIGLASLTFPHMLIVETFKLRKVL